MLVWGPAWMTAPYSVDLRERALARKVPGETNREIAAALRISPSCVSKWTKRKRETGSPAVHHAVTAANVNDISAAKAMPIEAGATLRVRPRLLRLRLLGQARRARLPAGDALQEQHAVERAARNALEPGTIVLGDRIGFLPARQAMNRKNPIQDVGSARSSSRPRPARPCAS